MRTCSPPFSRISALLVLALVVGCSSDNDTNPTAPVIIPPGGDQAELVLMTGWWEASPEESRTAEIPGTVTAVSLSITTKEETVTRDTTLAGDDTRAEFSLSLEAGRMARFEMLAADAGGTVLYRGVYYRMIPARTDSFFLTMAPVSDNTAPAMDGQLTVTPRSARDLELAWRMAATGPDMDFEAAYLIWATPAGQSPTALPTLSACPGETGLLLGGLQPDTSYDLTVRAVDRAGNISQSSSDLTAATLSTDAGLYVDVGGGQDKAGGGSAENPFKTITYALSQTEGYEPIFIMKGTYSADTGESFPLVLKPSTQLKGQIMFEAGYPLTRLVVGTTQAGIVCTEWNSVSGIELVSESAESSPETFIDARNGDLVVDFVMIDGKHGYSWQGIAAGRMALIRYSYFRNMEGGPGITVFGDDSSTVLGCQFADCNTGISHSGSNVSVAGCRMLDCLFAITGDDGANITLLNTQITGSIQGVQWEKISDSLVRYCQIQNSSGNGIYLIDCEASLNIQECFCVGNGSSGVYVSSGNVTLYKNVLTCNGLNLFVDGKEAVDARRNHWSANPPVVRSDAQVGNPEDQVDIYYSEVYAGTPEPRVRQGDQVDSGDCKDRG